MSGATTRSAAPEPAGWAPWQQRAWRLLNMTTAPVFLLMILLPSSSLTRRVVDAVAPLHVVLGLAYVGLLGRGIAGDGPRLDPADGASVARGLGRPDGFLAGWAHYLSFDLFVGAWIWRTAQAEGVGCRLELLLTWWAGPAGLTLFLARRRRLSAS